MGNIFILWRPWSGYSCWITKITETLSWCFQTRIKKWSINSKGTSCLWICCSCCCPWSFQIPTSRFVQQTYHVSLILYPPLNNVRPRIALFRCFHDLLMPHFYFRFRNTFDGRSRKNIPRWAWFTQVIRYFRCWNKKLLQKTRVWNWWSIHVKKSWMILYTYFLFKYILKNVIA